MQICIYIYTHTQTCMHIVTSIDNKSDLFWCRNLKVLPCGQFHTPGWVENHGCLSSYRSSWWSCTCAIRCDHWSCLGNKSKVIIFWAWSLFVEPSFWACGLWTHIASESLGKFFIWSDSRWLYVLRAERLDNLVPGSVIFCDAFWKGYTILRGVWKFVDPW